MIKPGKLIVITAPSGSGKTTIVHHILNTFPETAFSVSATTRAKRPHEIHGKDYFYLSQETFKSWIGYDAFVEWEEVYPNQFYGTLKSEVERLTQLGKYVVFDIDVKGAVNMQQLYPENTLFIFIRVPSIEILEKRLRARATDTEESLKKRIDRATFELTFEQHFDKIVVNDVLIHTLEEVDQLIRDFIQAP